MSMRSNHVAVLVALAGAFVSSAGAAEKEVGSVEEITAALKKAVPGDVLVMRDGEWADAVIPFTGRGTREKPIALRAKTPGGVKLSGKSGVHFDGAFLVVSGLYFVDSSATESVVTFKGSDNRFTDSAIVAPGRGGKWIHFREGRDHRFDHNYVEGHAPADVTLQVEVAADGPNGNRIDHNHFGPRPPLGCNGGEIMRIGYSGQQTRRSATVVEHNLFDRCDGELEIISNKSADNVYRHNTFRDCEGTLTLRHGDKATVDGNCFFGKANGKSGGIRVIGAGHTIINNYFENCSPSAGGVIALTCGMREPRPTEYQHVNGALVAFNTIVNCGLPYLRTDAGFDPGRTRDVLPNHVIVANNLFVAGKTDGKGEAGQRLVEGREGEGFAWIGNLSHGAEVGGAASASKGFRMIDPKLARGEDNMYRPAKDSPVRGAAEGDFAQVDHDLDRQPRGAAKDVGADQVSDERGGSGPLNPGDVGPSWMNPPRGGGGEGSASALPSR